RMASHRLPGVRRRPRARLCLRRNERAVSCRKPISRPEHNVVQVTTTKVVLIPSLFGEEIHATRSARKAFRDRTCLEKNLEETEFEHCTSRKGGGDYRPTSFRMWGSSIAYR